jgi:two-component system alkaline phosphatase synthesis response regulator PhoP
MEENKNIKILLVDDDRFLLDMYVLKFKKNGFDVDTAPGSALALTKLRSGQHIDIIILDIIMPTMDGLELLKIIREEKLVPDAVIVILTNNQNEDQKRAEELGIDGYIIKATTLPSEVVEKVKAIYQNKHKK